MQAFVYLAGRGLQYDGDNYFVPVDAQINRDADVPIDALRISDFAHALAQTPGRARIIVLDAARANPYVAQGSPLAPGLALVDPEPGELIAFNAAPGTLAGEEQGPYGVYGKTLAGAMRQGGVRIEDVFDQTRVTVNQETQGALIPWSASKLGEPYYIFERAAGSPPPAAVAAGAASVPIAGLPAEAAYAAALQRDSMRGYEEYLAAYPDGAQARRVRAILAARREASFWRRSVNANTAHAFWTYLRVYPRGPHVWDARRRLAMISAAFEPPPDFAPMVYQGLPPPPPDEDFYEAQPVYAFDAFGPRRCRRRRNITRTITTSKTMIGAICAAAAARRRRLSVGPAARHSARGRRGRVPALQRLQSLRNCARRCGPLPAASARAASVAAQRHPRAAAGAHPGPRDPTRGAPRQAAAADRRSSAGGNRSAGPNACRSWQPPRGRASYACGGREIADGSACRACPHHAIDRRRRSAFGRRAAWRRDSAGDREAASVRARRAGPANATDGRPRSAFGRQAAWRCNAVGRRETADGLAHCAGPANAADGRSRSAFGRQAAWRRNAVGRRETVARRGARAGEGIAYSSAARRHRPDDANHHAETISQAAGTAPRWRLRPPKCRICRQNQRSIRPQ